MTAHRKGTGAVDKNRSTKHDKMDRETNDAGSSADLRGLGREERAQQARADEETADVAERDRPQDATADELVPPSQRGDAS